MTKVIGRINPRKRELHLQKCFQCEHTSEIFYDSTYDQIICIDC